MIVTVRLFGHFQEQLLEATKTSCIQFEVEPGTTVSAVLSYLNIAPGNQPVVIQSHKVLQKTDVLDSPDEIQIMQPLGGG